ncbi:MAG: N-formylglutamate amidohydrolase [Magnetospirillum gryphiswaldense]|nr:N-formylglutamate amidohydrolase [Magnetospirillum gryphiswaldense]
MLRFIADPLADPPAFQVVPATSDAAVLIACDHASALIPPRHGDLGLDQETRQAHVAWDIGAAKVATALAGHLGCAAVLAGISRLVIDCNRQPGDPSSIPACTCGVAVPGNQGLDDAEAEARAESWFWPYHRELGTHLARLLRHGPVPAMVSVHSFTPNMGEFPRPWHVGVLWNRDGRMALPVLDALRKVSGLCVGDNQPYSGREINYTLDTHAGAAGLPHVSFEIRQDLLADDDACQRWGALLAQVLVPVLANPDLRRIQVF